MASVKLNKRKETGERKAAIDKVDKDEIELLFVQLRGLIPKFKDDLKGAKAYNSHMFTVEKCLATGEHQLHQGHEQKLGRRVIRQNDTVKQWHL